jgi:hypothetical protein
LPADGFEGSYFDVEDLPCSDQMIHEGRLPAPEAVINLHFGPAGAFSGGSRPIHRCERRFNLDDGTGGIILSGQSEL